jgi:hypothetical protein
LALCFRPLSQAEKSYRGSRIGGRSFSERKKLAKPQTLSCRGYYATI